MTQHQLNRSQLQSSVVRSGVAISLLLILLAQVTDFQGVRRKLSGEINSSFVVFEENLGQSPTDHRFIAQGAGHTALFSPKGVELRLYRATSNEGSLPRKLTRKPAFRSQTLRFNWLNARTEAEMTGIDRIPSTTAYLVGSDATKWLHGISQFERITVRDIYKQIDLVWRGSTGLEYDFIVAPGGDVSAIKFAVEGARGTRLSSEGDLLIETELGEVRQKRPFVFQEIEGQRTGIDGSFTTNADGSFGFRIGNYDARHPLVIDPVLLYSSPTGVAGADGCTAIAVDDSGHAYVTGVRPALNQPANSRVLTQGFLRRIDTNRSGPTAVEFNVFFGGNTGPTGGGNDGGLDIATDGHGTVFITGFSDSTNFPLRNAYQSTLSGESSAILMRINTTLSIADSLIYSTYLGGSMTIASGGTFPGVSIGFGVDTDGNGDAFITGFTNSTNFPVRNAFFDVFQGGIEDVLYGDAFVTRFDTDLSGDASLVYSTYFGGTEDDGAADIAAESNGRVYITGLTASGNLPFRRGLHSFRGGGTLVIDAFVAGFDTTKIGNESLLYSTFLGGTRDEAGFGIAMKAAGVAYVTGLTNSSDFPVRNGFQGALRGASPSDEYPYPDAFVTGLNMNLDGDSALVYSTFLGGDGGDGALDIAVDSQGFAYVTGGTEANGNFPLKDVVPRTPNASDAFDAFVTKIDPSQFGQESLVYSTLIGGAEFDVGVGIAVNWSGAVSIAGLTNSLNWPLVFATQAGVAGFGEIDLSRFSPIGEVTLEAGDGFLAKIGNAAVIASAASFAVAPQARGGIAAAFGTNLSIDTGIAATIPLPTILAGTSATLNDSTGVDRPIRLFFVSPGQINFLVPPEAALGAGLMTISRADGRTQNGTFTVIATLPSLFSANSSGQGVAAAQIIRVLQNGTQITEQVAVFDGGSSSFVPLPIEFGPSSEVLFLVLYGTGFTSGGANPIATIGNAAVTPEYVGPQGTFSGLDQANVRLPRTLIGAGLVNVTLNVANQTSNTVQVQFK